MKRGFWTAIVLAGLTMSSLSAGTITCKATQVNSPSFHKKEMNNVGAGGRMKIKWFEQFGLVEFDVSALKGKKIKEAWLHVKPAGGHKYGLNNGTDLTWISVTGVASAWNGKKACANHNGIRSDWGFPGAKTYDVACGHSYTFRCNTRLSKSGSSHRARLDPEIVQALVSGASYGIFIMDGSTRYNMNCRISNPSLQVVTDGEDTEAPAAPSEVRTRAAPNWATREHGAIFLRFKVPAGAFSFNIKADGKALPRWQIPFAKPGEIQTFTIVDLPPEKEVAFEVTAVDAAGNISPPVTVSGKSSPKLTVPALPAYGFKPKGGAPKSLGSAKVYAFPELTMVDPTSGKAYHEDVSDLSQKNAVWDGASSTVRLASARAEIVSFQLAIAGQISDVRIALSDLQGSGGSISASGVKLWRNWYVGKFSEYALPLKGGVSCPMADNKIDGQTLQAVTVDLHVPKGTKAGLYKGKVTLTAGADTAELNLQVKVFNVVIPEEIFFNPEMNCYGGPGQAGSDQFFNSFKLAHYHRSTINRVPYSQNGRIHKDWAPDVGGDGKVTDWSRFDKNIGPLVDGSLFKGNPRSGVPVASLYLPHFEGWPVNYRKHYKPGSPMPSKRDDNDNITKHHILAKPINEAMSQDYKAAFTNCVSDFYQHAKEKNWNRTAFQCYLNNKSNYGYSCWILDEPATYRDWEALNFWGELWKKGINDPEVYTWKWINEYNRKGLSGLDRGKPVFLFRGDISRPHWQGNLSDGLMNIIYIGGGGFDKLRMVKRWKRTIPSIMYAYGSCPKYKNSKWETAAWCLKAFTHESDGVLPWQSLGKGLTSPDRQGNSLIVNAGEYGNAIASFRVHAFRRGAQDCELLRLLMLKKGWCRQHMGLLVAQKVPLTAEYKQAFVDQAAALKFGKMTSQGFCEMKEGVLQLLAK